MTFNSGVQKQTRSVSNQERRRRGGIPACIADGIPACLAGIQGWGVVSQHALQVSRPTPKGEVEGSGLSRPTPRGESGLWGSPGPTKGISRPKPRGSPGPHLGGLQAHTWGISRPTPRGGSQHALRQKPPLPTVGYCCGRYASYWNAFLLFTANRTVLFYPFQYDWPDISDHPTMRETKIEYKFDYLPAGLFNRGQVNDQAIYITLKIYQHTSTKIYGFFIPPDSDSDYNLLYDNIQNCSHCIGSLDIMDIYCKLLNVRVGIGVRLCKKDVTMSYFFTRLDCISSLIVQSYGRKDHC